MISIDISMFQKLNFSLHSHPQYKLSRELVYIEKMVWSVITSRAASRFYDLNDDND